MFNLISLILGLCAWLFAVLSIINNKIASSHKFTFTSFSLCLISLLFQFLEINRRVTIGDFVAIEDTIHAVLFASAILVFVTVSLNLAVMLKRKYNTGGIM